MRELWPRGWARVKDYVSTPKPNGYQSLHIWLGLPDTDKLEVQIRTCRMHRECLSGAASHSEYKQQPPRACSPQPIQIVARPVEAIS